MEVASSLPDVVYVQDDQAFLPYRFPNIPTQFPDNTIPITQYTEKVAVTALRNRRFTINLTQIPLTPANAATTHKLQGATCDAIMIYKPQEPEDKGLRYMSLCHVPEN